MTIDTKQPVTAEVLLEFSGRMGAEVKKMLHAATTPLIARLDKQAQQLAALQKQVAALERKNIE